MSSSIPPEITGQPLENVPPESTRFTYQYRVASLWRGPIAVIVDGLLIYLAIMAFVVAIASSGALERADPTAESYYGISVFLGVPFVYCWYFWVHQNGQTPGKRLVGIRVVRVDGQPITTQTATVRFAGYVINALTVGLGWIIALVDSERRGLHDRLAGTRVVMARPARVPAKSLPNAPLLDPAPDTAHAPLMENVSGSAAQITPPQASAMPIVTYALIAVNVVIFLLTTGQRPYVWGATNQDLILRTGEYYRLVSAMFLHANVEHIFFNMLALFMTGRLLERYIGPTRFFLIYFGGGLAGSLTSMLLNPNISSLGASGAVFAVFGAAMLFEFRYRDSLDGQTRKEFAQAGGTIALNFFNGIRPGSGIDNWAHLGGLVGGLGVAVLVFYIRFADHRRALQVLSATLVIATLFLGTTALPVLSARTISEGGITLRVPQGWHVMTDLDSHPACQQLREDGIHCQMLLFAPSGVVYEIDHLSGTAASFSLAQFAIAAEHAMKQEGAVSVSQQEITLDGADAIQLVYEAGETNRMLVFAKTDGTVVRFYIEGEPDTFNDSRAEIDTLINSVHFNAEPVPSSSGETALPEAGDPSQTFTSSGVALTISDGWRTKTNFSDVAFCNNPGVECLFVAGPSPDFFFELVRFEYVFLLSPTVEQQDEALWEVQQQNPRIELESRQEFRVDGRSAIQRIFTDGEETYLALFVDEGESRILRLWAEGTSSSFEQYRQDLNTSIDSLRFTSDENE